MSKIAVTLFFLTASLCCYGQNVNKNDTKVNVSKCSYFGISKPLSEISDFSETKEKVIVPKNGGKERRVFSKDKSPNSLDPVLQNIHGERSLQPPLVSFDGTAKIAGIPPDPSGAAGKNQYVHAVNLGYQVFDKKGKSIKGPLDLSALWEGSESHGDPIVMYDEFAERWVICQFQFQVNEVQVAVSETEDATGKYFAYKFKLDKLPDYFKVSIWPDAYYITANSAGQNVIALEREKMLVGDDSARMVAIHYDFVNDEFMSPLPADADGELPPLGTPNYVFSFIDDAWSGQSKDEIKIFKMEVNWDDPQSSSFTLHQTLEPKPFDTEIGSDWDNIAQKGTDQKLDAILDIFNYRAQYRRWVEYNTVMLAHTVDADGNDKAGIRWYELRDDGNGQWEIHQESTYAPDEHSRFIPSIGMDKYGNIGLAYSISSKDVYPGLRYTGRLKDDKLGEMTFEEEIGIEGGGVQQGLNRYGDYGHLTLDPADGITFWFTGEYLGDNGIIKTRVFSFKIDDGTIGVNDGEVSKMEANVSLVNGALNVNVVNLKDNKELLVDLFTMRGELIQAKKTVPTNNSFTHTFDVSKLAKGTYLLRFGNRSFQEVKKVVFK